MDEYTERKLEGFIDGMGLEASVDDVYPQFQEKLEVVEQKVMEDAEDRQKVDYAVAMLQSDDIRADRTGTSGEQMPLDILSIGHRGVWEDHPATDTDTVTAHGIIHGHLDGPDEDPRASPAVIMLERPEVDLLEAQSKFSPLNELHGTFEVEEAWDLKGFHRVYSTEDTTLEERDIPDLPSGRDDKNEMLRQMFPDVELSSLAEDGEGLSAFDPDSGFTHDWGADIKRFTGTIVDYYVKDDRSWGAYTVMDDSVLPEDIDANDMIVGDSQQTPGLTVHCEPDYHMQYGNNSIVDVYGVVEKESDTGQITIRAAGIVPIVPMEMDDGDAADDGVQATESSL